MKPSKRKLILDSIVCLFVLTGMSLLMYSMLNVEGFVNLLCSLAGTALLWWLKLVVDEEHYEDKIFYNYR